MKKVNLLLCSIFLLIMSCSDETTVFSDFQDDIQLEGNEQILDNSVSFDYAGVLEIAEEVNISGKQASASKVDEAGDYPLTLIAQIDPPSYSGGENLTASHVHVDGDYAYVSYNTVEDDYAGGIDIIDVSDPTDPKVTSRLYYVNADLNAIEYSDGYIYAVGGVDSEKSVTATSNSFVAKIPASGGRMYTSAGIDYGFQEGYNSTDIEVTSNTVVVSSGGDGTVTIYNKSDLSILNEAPFQDLRSVKMDNGLFAVLDAGSGVSILDDNLNVIKEIPINTDFGAATKRTLAFKDGKVIVSEGSIGAGLYNVASGSLIEYLPVLIDPSATSTEGSETNAVALNEEMILMANGGSGLCLSEDNGDDADLYGVIQLEGSINYVESKDDYIFAASGKSGLQIIKLNRTSESLSTRCSSLSTYSGSSDLNVRLGEDKAYSGSKRFANIEVAGTLLLCGSWTVNNGVDVYSDALFEMYGTLVVGRNNKRKDVMVDEGATFVVEGNLTIYGDLILNDGAKLEFIGNDSVVNIFGSVVKNGTVNVSGNYDDVRNKF
ncbi:hypothetical protein R3X28_07460 [Maribacter sp. TH_r10]|uniref:hypothetical protein n=1 Tax=Maribacter sp. TH_r10 TaxID=3082086 RepID=UPI002955D6D9|nr:hypothetical protein [Maribacter sp. TH_r10]MDV7138707.1 hypothetical protein [Maribacter sp. TH_r10]